MSFDYITQCYGLRFHRGQRVVCGDRKKTGTVTSATHHVHVRLDGQKHTLPYHPSDVKPIEENGDGT